MLRIYAYAYRDGRFSLESTVLRHFPKIRQGVNPEIETTSFKELKNDLIIFVAIKILINRGIKTIYYFFENPNSKRRKNIRIY